MLVLVQVVPRPRQRRNGWNGDMIPENQRGRAGSAAASIEDDVAYSGLYGKFNVFFNMLG